MISSERQLGIRTITRARNFKHHVNTYFLPTEVVIITKINLLKQYDFGCHMHATYIGHKKKVAKKWSHHIMCNYGSQYRNSNIYIITKQEEEALYLCLLKKVIYLNESNLPG